MERTKQRFNQCEGKTITTAAEAATATTTATTSVCRVSLVGPGDTTRKQEQRKVNMGYDDDEEYGAEGDGNERRRTRSASPPKVVDVEKIKPNTEENKGEIRSVHSSNGALSSRKAPDMDDTLFLFFFLIFSLPPSHNSAPGVTNIAGFPLPCPLQVRLVPSFFSREDLMSHFFPRRLAS